MGEKENGPFQFTFNGLLKVAFQGSHITSDAGLILVRELDERLGLEQLITDHLSDSRHGTNTQFRVADLLRQSVYSRLAGYEDLNDAVRLSTDPTFRLIGSPKRWDRTAALTSTLHWFETELLTGEGNLVGLMALNRDMLAQTECVDHADRVVLDMDSSERPVHGQQEGSAYNGHFESVCYHPLFLFNGHGDCLAAKLRSGNVHSADDWDELLLPEIDRQQAAGTRVAFRADAAFAKPAIYDKCTTMSDHDQPVAANLLDRQFAAAAPNQRWVGDTTEFVIGGSGKLYLAAILDLFSRFIVGWAVSAVNDRHVTIKALEMALKRRYPEVGLLHHSDQGCTYASKDYQSLLDARGIVCSMSRRGNCYDNSVMESFFSTVKSELGEHFDSHGDAKMELFDYIEVFYNHRRRHSPLGQISPAAFERRAAA